MRANKWFGAGARDFGISFGQIAAGIRSVSGREIRLARTDGWRGRGLERPA